MKPPQINDVFISDLNDIVHRLEDYYTADEIWTWLDTPHPQLCARAIDLINEGKSIEVLHVLDRMDSQAYL